MRHHLHKHFTRAAAHHSDMAAEHHGLHELHTAHAVHHADEGDHIKAAHHREVATHHKRLAKLHGEHSEHLAELAEDFGSTAGTQPHASGYDTAKVSDAEFMKAMIGEL